MEQLRCNGCKAGLKPQDKNVQFITCEYCRATITNPKFEAPVNHNQHVQQSEERESPQSVRPNKSYSLSTIFILAFLGFIIFRHLFVLAIIGFFIFRSVKKNNQ